MYRIFKNIDVKILCVQFYAPFSLARIDSISNIYIVLKTFFQHSCFLDYFSLSRFRTFHIFLIN